MFAILRPAITVFAILTVVTGVVYPLAITVLGQVLFNHQANGGIIERRKNGDTIGNYFVHRRPVLTVISGTTQMESIEHR